MRRATQVLIQFSIERASFMVIHDEWCDEWCRNYGISTSPSCKPTSESDHYDQDNDSLFGRLGKNDSGNDAQSLPHDSVLDKVDLTATQIKETRHGSLPVEICDKGAFELYAREGTEACAGPEIS